MLKEKGFYETLLDIPYVTMVVLFIIGVFGGLTAYFKRENREKLNTGEKVIFFLTDFVVAFTISILAFFTFTGFGLNEVASIGLSGWASTLGQRFVFKIEAFLVYHYYGKKGLADLKEFKSYEDEFTEKTGETHDCEKCDKKDTCKVYKKKQENNNP